MTQAMEPAGGRIGFQARLQRAGSWTILRLPRSASARLPSRGMAMVEGTVNGIGLKCPLEPDGSKGHWLKVEKGMLEGIGANPGDTVTLEIEVSREWPEPLVPRDLKEALAGSERAHRTWKDTTPAAHRDWVRWIRSTKNPETRKKRIGVAVSKLDSGDRRPCCLNRNACTLTEVSSNGVLLDDAATSQDLGPMKVSYADWLV